MEDIERLLRTFRLAEVPKRVADRIVETRGPTVTRNRSRRFWLAVAAAVLLLFMMNLWMEAQYVSSPYTSPVPAGQYARVNDWEKEKSDVIALLGEDGHAYLI